MDRSIAVRSCGILSGRDAAFRRPDSAGALPLSIAIRSSLLIVGAPNENASRFRCLCDRSRLLANVRRHGTATRQATTEELNPQRFELAVESGYLFGAINPPAGLPDWRGIPDRARSVGSCAARHLAARLQPILC